MPVPVGVFAEDRDDGRICQRDCRCAKELTNDDEQQQQKEGFLNVLEEGKALSDDQLVCCLPSADG